MQGLFWDIILRYHAWLCGIWKLGHPPSSPWWYCNVMCLLEFFSSFDTGIWYSSICNRHIYIYCYSSLTFFCWKSFLHKYGFPLFLIKKELNFGHELENRTFSAIYQFFFVWTHRIHVSMFNCFKKTREIIVRFLTLKALKF